MIKKHSGWSLVGSQPEDERPFEENDAGMEGKRGIDLQEGEKEVNYLEEVLTARDGLEYEDTESEIEIRDPFDPTKIRVDTRPMTIDLIIKRIQNEEINLKPGFQRHGGIWSNRSQSRLIESILIRIPLPAFYMDASDDDCWLVIDGLQRLTTLQQFVIEKSLRLRDLEFLNEYNGKTFDDLPRALQRRIEETQITVYLVQSGTPHNVKFNIFKRINTTGLPLSGQEIRHALNQGKATDLLEELSQSGPFLRATDSSVNPKRMMDRECVLRFLSFWMVSPQEYFDQRAELDPFLNDSMRTINGMEHVEIEQLKEDFYWAMDASYRIFGERGFRKWRHDQERRSPISKALYEVWAVNLCALNQEQVNTLVARKETLINRFKELMDDQEFDDAISYSTGDPRRVLYRFQRIADIIKETLA